MSPQIEGKIKLFNGLHGLAAVFAAALILLILLINTLANWLLVRYVRKLRGGAAHG